MKERELYFEKYGKKFNFKDANIFCELMIKIRKTSNINFNETYEKHSYSYDIGTV